LTLHRKKSANKTVKRIADMDDMCSGNHPALCPGGKDLNDREAMTVRRPSPDEQDWGRQLRWIVGHPAILPCLLLAIQTIPSLWAKDVWFSDEVRHAAVLVQMIERGHWLVLHLGDTFYPDKPPLYFWVLAAISQVSGSTAPSVFMAGAAVSAFVFLIATIRAAGLFGLSRQVALLAGLLLVSNYYFILRAHFPRMDLLFATFILLSHVCFFQAVAASQRQLLWTTAAFFMAALATLTKGPIGFVLPLVGLFVFVVLERRTRAIISHSMMVGSLAFIVPMLLYLTGVYLISGEPFIRAILIDQTLQRALDTPRLQGPFYYYLLKLPEIFLPWSLIVVFLPWRRILATRRKNQSAPPPPANSRGERYLFISAATSLAVISVFDYKITFLLITLLPQVALLCAIHLHRLEKGRRMALFALITLFYICAAAILPFAGDFTLWPDQVSGEVVVALACIPMIVGMLLTVKRRPLVFCAVAAIGSTVVTLPLFLISIRGLDAVMSTADFGAYLGRVAASGHSTVYYHPFRSGIFDYHAGTVIPYLNNLQQVRAHMTAHKCGVLVMRNGDWTGWSDKPDNPVFIAEQQLDYESYVLIGWGGTTCRLPDKPATS